MGKKKVIFSRRFLEADASNKSAPMPEDSWAHRSSKMRCLTCMWYAPKNYKLGRCRNRAPSPDSTKGWPVVFITDWCGSHKLDENKEDRI